MAISRWWVGLVPVQSLIQKKLLGEDRNRQIRRSEDPGTGPWHVSGGGVSPEHIHHHRDKTLALVASMICIGTCSENSRSPRIKFARHMFNTNSPEKSPSKTFRNASNIYRSLKIS
ncbi:hypothetical protein XU18_2443 [Perkinsela sp. CCAP 1560/4]|nr:hypothetical protein XU18_2443 [Perkinsela sp. CCAP 1560/4]|eukprot:KNH06770.1 hypothetical protein XU18_2443 [Perkinsela sp. CCAP 1560/4]